MKKDLKWRATEWRVGLRGVRDLDGLDEKGQEAVVNKSNGGLQISETEYKC